MGKQETGSAGGEVALRSKVDKPQKPASEPLVSALSGEAIRAGNGQGAPLLSGALYDPEVTLESLVEEQMQRLNKPARENPSGDDLSAEAPTRAVQADTPKPSPLPKYELRGGKLRPKQVPGTEDASKLEQQCAEVRPKVRPVEEDDPPDPEKEGAALLERFLNTKGF